MSNQQHICKFATACFAFGVLSLFLAGGCNESSVAETSQVKTLPKLNFHKPRNFGLAIERIRTIHDELTTADELPIPISYTVVEVSHGDSNVSYELVSVSSGSLKHCSCDCGHDHADVAGDEEPVKDTQEKLAELKEQCETCEVHSTPFSDGPKQHTVYVDAFTELEDLIRWLPEIVADSDIDSDEQQQAVTASQQFASQLKSLAKTENKTEKKKLYADVDSINGLIEELETIVKPNAAAILN